MTKANTQQTLKLGDLQKLNTKFEVTVGYRVVITL